LKIYFKKGGKILWLKEKAEKKGKEGSKE